MDMWLGIRNMSTLNNLRVGQFRNPTGMDRLTSVTQLTFLERALPFAFLPFRQISLMAHDYIADMCRFGVQTRSALKWATMAVPRRLHALRCCPSIMVTMVLGCCIWEHLTALTTRPTRVLVQLLPRSLETPERFRTSAADSSSHNLGNVSMIV